MTDSRIFATSSPTFSSTGLGFRALEGDAMGNAGSIPWKQRLVNAGYGYHVTIGAFSTPIVGGGNGTVFDQDQPEGIISVPSGTVIMPIRISVQCHVPLLATDADESEILIAVDRLAAWAGDGTVTSETAFNMRTDNSRTSNTSCASAATANITNPTLGIELASTRITGDVQGTAATALWTGLNLLYEPETPPVLVGPCAIYIYWGGTVATSGFAQAQFLELSGDAATKYFGL